MSHNPQTSAMEASVKLFQQVASGKNDVFSPLSVLAVLAMLEQGAKGETLKQLRSLVGEDADELSSLLAGLFKENPISNAFSGAPTKVNFANAIWIREDDELQIEQSFLEKQNSFAEIHKSPFSPATCGEINAWCNRNTGGKISKIINSLPEDSALVLLNALAFSAKWKKQYKESDVRDRTFTTESGKKRTAAFLHSTENRYLRDECAEGFTKPYSGGRYSFAALLPEEGLPLDEYIAGLTGERLLQILTTVEGGDPLDERMLEILGDHKPKPIRRHLPKAKIGARNAEVITATPKFKFESKIDLEGALHSLGLTDMFDEYKADFSGIGKSTDPEKNLCVGACAQKAFIDLNEKGTEAAAVTMFVLQDKCLGSMTISRPYEVILDRPFLYLIIDNETNLPLFIGTVRDVGK